MHALLATLWLAVPSSPVAAQEAHCAVQVVERDGELNCSLQADNARLVDVLELLAERAQLRIAPVDLAWRRTLVSVELRERPLRQVLAYLLGSAGLRCEVRGAEIVISEADSARPDAGDLYEASIADYLHVLRDFSNHALAPRAQMALAEIEQRRGNPAAARAHYTALVEHYPDSQPVPNALWNVAQSWMSENAWSDASQSLSDLLRAQRAPELERPARLALARCAAMLGQYERALGMLDALDSLAPALHGQDELERSCVRVRALAGLGQSDEALAVLDRIDRESCDEPTRREALELRALAFKAAERWSDAARAWLALSRVVEHDGRERALSEAAYASALAGDSLGVLFVERLARADGLACDELAQFATQARAGLALQALALDDETAAQRLERAERLLDSHMSAQALSTLRALAPSRAALDAPLQLRCGLALARALNAELGVDAALAELRTTLANTIDAEAHRRIYLLAADMLEGAGRFDDAIEALRGTL